MTHKHDVLSYPSAACQKKVKMSLNENVISFLSAQEHSWHSCCFLLYFKGNPHLAQLLPTVLVNAVRISSSEFEDFEGPDGSILKDTRTSSPWTTLSYPGQTTSEYAPWTTPGSESFEWLCMYLNKWRIQILNPPGMVKGWARGGQTH